MRTIELGCSGLQVPVIGIGCMRLNRLDEKHAQRHLLTALEHGANFFDHADIYGDGTCERLFAKSIGMSNSIREKIILQSKCGIVPGVRYDQSKAYILHAVEGILSRLNTEYLDVLLIHRPDALVEPEEVAEAFEILYSSGKVCHFGVSNHNSSQVELLRKYLEQRLVANQLQLSIANASLITEGLFVNMPYDEAINRNGGVLNYCRLNGITIQPWSPFQYGYFEGIFIGSDKFPDLNRKLEELADKYQVTAAAIALAWLLRHPARMQPIVGTTDTNRLAECLQAAKITLSRDEWYSLYLAAGNMLP